MSRFPVAVALSLSGISSALAGGLGFAASPVPTLDEFGLLGLTIVVAIAGGIAVRRKKK